MTRSAEATFDPRLDLLLERVVDVPRALVWRAWTDPEQIKQWFTPAPWRTVECEIDLRPGGVFRTVMRSPEGQEFPNAGCYLDIVENERLVWTNALGAGYRPSQGGGAEETTGGELTFTAAITLEDHDGGTRYRALAMHGEAAMRDRHEAMGFQDGWGAAFDQLVAMIKRG